MPDQTNVTVTDNSGTSIHVISFRGISGAIFWLTFASLLLFLVAFATEGWAESSTLKVGLWRSCNCAGSAGFESQSWFKASQAMFCIAFICMIGTMVLLGLYMVFHSLNKNTLLFLIIVASFVTVLFMFIGLMIFGLEIEGYRLFDLSFSFAFACIATIMCCIAGGLGVYQKLRAKQ